jgi:hypothetical protein
VVHQAGMANESTVARFTLEPATAIGVGKPDGLSITLYRPPDTAIPAILRK